MYFSSNKEEISIVCKKMEQLLPFGKFSTFATLAFGTGAPLRYYVNRITNHIAGLASQLQGSAPNGLVPFTG